LFWVGFILLVLFLTSGQAWERTYGGSGSDDGYSVEQTSDGGYIIVGATTSFADSLGDVYLIKTDSSGNSGGIEEHHDTQFYLGLSLEIQSPCNDKLNISYFLPTWSRAQVELFDITGKRVAVYEDGERPAGWHHLIRTLSLPSGVYFVRLSASLQNQSIARKIILLR